MLPEALAQQNLEARNMIRRDELGRRHIGPPIHFREEPASPVLREPLLGEHTQVIFGG
jgi:crotonobetainyl-CoA:carnitine CoA-transferase CaiB-like acyl-CoA transferase